MIERSSSTRLTLGTSVDPMGKVGFDPAPVQAWLDERHGGDQLLAFTRVFTPSGVSPSDGSSVDVTGVASTRGVLGLDPAQQYPVLGMSVGLFAISPQQFYVLRVGGLRPRIKATVIESPRAQVTISVRDLEHNRQWWRHWVIGLPDGRFILEPQCLGKAGKPSKVAPASEHFFVALADQVRRV